MHDAWWMLQYAVCSGVHVADSAKHNQKQIMLAKVWGSEVTAYGDVRSNIWVQQPQHAASKWRLLNLEEVFYGWGIREAIVCLKMWTAATGPAT